MNRREMMLTGVGAAIAAGVLPQAAWATPQSWIGWGPGAKESPHAAMVLEWIGDKLKAGEVFIATDLRLIDQYVILEEPKFLIETGTEVWSHMTGFTGEPGLKITLWVKGHLVGESKVGTTVGSTIIPAEEHGYYVRFPYVPYENMKTFDDAGVRIRDCMKWLDYLKVPAAA